MRDLMDGEEEIMVHRPAERVCTEKEGRREGVRCTEYPCQRALREHNTQDDPLCERFVSH